MIPRTRVDTVRFDEPIDAVLTRMATGHTRYPVVGDTTDEVLGVIDLHAVLDAEPSATAGRAAGPRSRFRRRCPFRRRSTGSARPATKWRWSSTNTAASPESSPLRTSLRSWSARSPTNTTGPASKSPSDRRLAAARRHTPRRGRTAARSPAARRRLRNHGGTVDPEFGRLPAVGESIEIPLPSDSAGWSANRPKSWRPPSDPSSGMCPPKYGLGTRRGRLDVE